MAGESPFHIIGETIEVVELGQGVGSPRLNRPDIAAKALKAMQESVERTGATMDNSHLRLIVDEVFEDEDEGDGGGTGG